MSNKRQGFADTMMGFLDDETPDGPVREASPPPLPVGVTTMKPTTERPAPTRVATQKTATQKRPMFVPEGRVAKIRHTLKNCLGRLFS